MVDIESETHNVKWVRKRMPDINYLHDFLFIRVGLYNYIFLTDQW